MHAAIGDQRSDGVFELGLADVAVDGNVARLHAGLGCLLLLAANVDLAGLVVADQHRRQAHGRTAGSFDLGTQLGDDVVAQLGAVHDHGRHCAHDSPTISPCSSKSMIDAAGAEPRPGMVVMSPQIG